MSVAATVAPTGKQNSFASRARASYLRCEVGDQQPRSLSVAFLKPVKDADMIKAAIKNLEGEAERQDKAYGKCVDDSCVMNVAAGEGTFSGSYKICYGKLTMLNFLIFQLYGQMAAWGEIAVGEYRPSRDYPSKSALIGMVAAGFGDCEE